MAITTDSIGNWEEVTTQFVNQFWKVVLITPSDPLILRFTYLVDWEQWEDKSPFRSYARARFYYDDLSEDVSPSFPLYPKPQREIRKITGLITQLPIRKIGFLQYSYSRSKYIRADLLPWQLKVEKLIL